MGTRRRARRLAIFVLYQADVLDEPIAARRACVLADEEVSDEQAAFVRRLVDLYDRHSAAVDRALRESGANWELERMSATDRAVLRIAVTELLLVPDVPPPVSLDEAIEIARDYGGEESGRFVNGVLDAVLRRVQAPAEEEEAEPVDDQAPTDPARGE